MNVGKALTEAMAESRLRDEDVAVAIGVSAQQVRKWRLGRSEPRRSAYDSLRQKISGFADRMDGRAVA